MTEDKPDWGRLPEQPWNTEQGGAAIAKMVRMSVAVGLVLLIPADPRGKRDLAREWLVARGWTISCSASETRCRRGGKQAIHHKDHNLALIAAVEATLEEATDGQAPA